MRIQYDEKQNIEFKESWRDEYLKWLCGFANAQGGTLYIGVNDKADVVGIENARKLLEDIPNKVRDALGIMVDVNLLEADGKNYLQIQVEPYKNPVSYKGEFHYRSGSTKQELKGNALTTFLLKKMGLTWDSITEPRAKIEDLDHAAFELFRKKARKAGRLDEADINLSDTELLEKLRLIENGEIKRGAILLFHKDPERYVTGAYVKVGYFNNDADILFQDEVHGNLFEQIDKLMEVIFFKYMKAFIRYEGIQRIEEFCVPKAAMREALLNAIIHKNYGGCIPIQIRIYKNKVVIWNDATLPDGWTVEKFLEKHGSRPYNPEIANAFFRAGEIESWGRGIEKICAALREQNLTPPEYEQLGEAVCTTFHFVEPTTSESTIPAGSVKNIHNDDERSSKTAQKVPKELPKEFPKELPKQAEATFIAIKNNPYATNDELAYILGISSRAVRNHIAVLKKVGFIRRGGSRTKGYWEIVE